MEESTLRRKSVNFIKKRMVSICHWLKMCAAEKYQKMWEDESKK